MKTCIKFSSFFFISLSSMGSAQPSGNEDHNYQQDRRTYQQGELELIAGAGFGQRGWGDHDCAGSSRRLCEQSSNRRR